MSTRPLATRLVFAALVAAVGAHPAIGQACDSITSRTSLADLSGRSIAAVNVVTQDPPSLSGPAHLLDVLHTRTRESTVRRQLLVAAGDTVDTLRIAESMRRLRHQIYLTDISIVGVHCAADSTVTLTVVTRDNWSMKAKVELKSNNREVVGVEERNIFGTGRQASVRVESRDNRVGVAALFGDPWLFGGPLSSTLRFAQFNDGTEYGGVIGTRERSVQDEWNVAGGASQSTHLATATPSYAFRRSDASILVTHRLGELHDRVITLLTGGEAERATLIAAPGSGIVGPDSARRRFAALDGGLGMRALSYDTLTWLLPTKPIVDVPLTVEGEFLVGAGPDLDTHMATWHYDAWLGRVFRPTHSALLVADLWSSGYSSDWKFANATARGRVMMYHAARHGSVTATLAGEKLFNPDPDLRSLSTSDPTLPAIPPSARLAEAAIAMNVDRTVHIHRLSRSWTLDAAGVIAASWRREPADSVYGDMGVALVGVGLQLTPNRIGRGMSRLMIAVPVMSSGFTPKKLVLGVTLAPWLEEDRLRDGRRN